MNPGIDNRGTERWRKDGLLHRDDGPAVIYTNGKQMWFRYGELHRLDGPAVVSAGKRNSWYVNNHLCCNQSQFKSYSGLTDEEVVLLVLKYGEIK